MTDQETSIRKYMETLANEIEECTDPGRANRLAMQLTRMRELLEQTKKEKGGD